MTSAWKFASVTSLIAPAMGPFRRSSASYFTK
jgi:hypothetical protein